MEGRACRRRRGSSLLPRRCARVSAVGDCRAPGRCIPARRQRPRAEGAPGAVARVLHGGERGPRRPRVGASVVRVYWNIGRAGAAALVRALTSRLNARGRPFRLKVADHPFRLDRCDAAVLYLPRETSARCGALREVAAGWGRTCGRDPRLHARARPGRGARRGRRRRRELRDRRCALLADAIVRAHGRRAGSTHGSPRGRPLRGGRRAARRAVSRALARRPPCPLTRSSTRPRRSAAASWPTPCGTRGAAAGSARSVEPAQPWPLDTAPSDRLLRRHRGRRPVPRSAGRRDRRGDVRRTAVGALRHAVARRRRCRRRRDGFHAGSLGIAWAAARAGALLDEEELRAGARTVLAEARPAPARSLPGRHPGQRRGDPRAARAGRRARRPALFEDAVATGDELIARATRDPPRLVVGDPWRRWPHHLCGLSHGAAGIGWALLELFAATGDERFRAGATGAFAYERSWLDADSGTWPDLRSRGQRRGAPRRLPAAAGTWCHGEAASRSRGCARAPCSAQAARHDAEVALDATRRDLAGRCRTRSRT